MAHIQAPQPTLSVPYGAHRRGWPRRRPGRPESAGTWRGWRIPATTRCRLAPAQAPAYPIESLPSPVPYLYPTPHIIPPNPPNTTTATATTNTHHHHPSPWASPSPPPHSPHTPHTRHTPTQRAEIDPRAVGLPPLAGAAPSALAEVEKAVGAGAAPVLLLQVLFFFFYFFLFLF